MMINQRPRLLRELPRTFVNTVPRTFSTSYHLFLEAAKKDNSQDYQTDFKKQKSGTLKTFTPCLFVFSPLDLHAPSSPEMNESVAAVERIVGHDFNTNNKKLLEEALTHSSCRINDAVSSYQRLAFLGDSVLGLAVSNHIFHAYPGIDQGELTSLRSANVSREKLARVAVRHGLYDYLRRTATTVLDVQVDKFTEAVSREEKTPLYGGSVEAPRVLAEIVESVAGAIYVDLNFDLKQLWMKFKHVLEPIVTLQEWEQQSVTKLNQLCQKHGKNLNMVHGRDGMKSTVRVYVDGAKNELHKLCAKKKWPEPIYTIEHEEGPPHEKKFVSKVTIDGVRYATGGQMSKRKHAENYAASILIRRLQDSDTSEVVEQSI